MGIPATGMVKSVKDNWKLPSFKSPSTFFYSDRASNSNGLE
jgi:hypothetical protein